MDQLSWPRRFYRAHLSSYKWAQLLKHIYLVLRLFVIQTRNFFIWQINRQLAVYEIWLSRTVSQNNMRAIQYSTTMVSSLVHRLLQLPNRLMGQKGCWYEMRGFSQYLASSTFGQSVLAPAREIRLAMPNVYPDSFKEFFHADGWLLHVPTIRAFEIPNAQVMGKSDLLFLGNQCLHHELYQFDRDFLFEEIHNAVSISATERKVVRFKGEHVGTLPMGISLVGSATANYVHWLTETLPKLALIDDIDAYRNMPYIIDADLHPNILESIYHLNSHGRELIQLGKFEMLSVDKLVAISPVAYGPFDFKPGIKLDKLDINPNDALYSPDGLKRVRELLVSRLGKTTDSPKQRIFLRRTGKSRPMANSAEIEAMMLELHFEIVEPETLSFAEQVQIFSSAELIVSQGGAALGNIIFAPPGCHVIVLTTWSLYTIHYYFSNLATLLDQRCTLIMCDPVQSDLGAHRAHMGVNVPINILKKAIQQ